MSQLITVPVNLANESFSHFTSLSVAQVEINKEYTHEEGRAGNPNPFGQIPGLTDDNGVSISLSAIQPITPYLIWRIVGEAI